MGVYGVTDTVQPILPMVLLVFGALMVSNVRMPKFSMRWSKPVNAFQAINMVAAYVLVPLQIFPEYLFALSAGYLVIGLTWGAVYAGQVLEEESANPQ